LTDIDAGGGARQRAALLHPACCGAAQRLVERTLGCIKYHPHAASAFAQFKPLHEDAAVPDTRAHMAMGMMHCSALQAPLAKTYVQGTLHNISALP